MIPPSLIDALGWTLIHSLWQASFVALLFYLISQSTRRPTHVYRWGVGALIVIAGWALYTFIGLYEPEAMPHPPVANHSASPAIMVEDVSAVATPDAPVSTYSWPTRLATWINPYLRVVTTGWLLGMLVLATRLVGGLWYLSRLKHHGTLPMPAWEPMLSTLVQRLRLHQTVRVLASERVKVPMVVGYFKPVILFPVALASSLPLEHIEAIIAHELAHLHRHDYWINILQSLVEVLFFYHPAVWWLSSAVRAEREKCCDDLAVSLCGNAIAYTKALAEAETWRQAPSSLVLALAQRRCGLLVRVERLIHPSSSTTNPAVKLLSVAATLLLIVLLAGGDTLAQWTQRGESQNQPRFMATMPAPTVAPLASDTVKPAPSGVDEEGWEGSDKAQTFTVPPVPPVSDEQEEPAAPEEQKQRSQFSFQVDDSTDVMVDMHLDFEEDEADPSHFFFQLGDQDHQNHLRIHLNDTFPTISWNDTTWLESIGELSRQMGDFSRELSGYLADSVDTETLQKQLGTVQRELGQLQAELGTSLQRSFNEERLEEWQRTLEKKQERAQRELERIQRTMERGQNRLEESRQRAHERQIDRRRQTVQADKYRNFDDTIDRLEYALLADKLVEKGKEYRFELKPKGLYINRKKQNAQLTKKYRDLLDITESTTFSITRVAE